MAKDKFGPPYGLHEGPDRDNPEAPGAPVAIMLLAFLGLAVTASWIWRYEILAWCARFYLAGPR